MKIILTQLAKDKIEVLTKLADEEISGLLKVEQINDTNVKVNDVILFKQTSSSAETELDTEALSKYLETEIKANRNVDDLKGWWHSHADMDTFWSSTDDENIETLGTDWLISIVSNKKGKMRGRIDIYHPFRMYVDEVDIIEEGRDLEKLEIKIQKEIDKKVKEAKKTNYLFDKKKETDTVKEKTGSKISKKMLEGNKKRFKNFNPKNEMVVWCDRCGYERPEKKIEYFNGTCPYCQAELEAESDYYENNYGGYNFNHSY